MFLTYNHQTVFMFAVSASSQPFTFGSRPWRCTVKIPYLRLCFRCVLNTWLSRDPVGIQSGSSPTQVNKNEFPTGSQLENVGLRLKEAWCVVRLVVESLISAAKSLKVRGARLRYSRRDVKKGGVPAPVALED